MAMTAEELKKLQALLQEEQAPVMAPNPVAQANVIDIADDPNAGIQRPRSWADQQGDPYAAASDQYNKEAADLEAKASAPMPKPKGLKENLISGARAFLEGLSNPRDPYAMAKRREDQYAQSQQDLVQRARVARQNSLQQQQLGMQARGQAQAQVKEEHDMEIANRPKYMTTNPGTVAEVPAQGGEPKFYTNPSMPPGAGKPANLQLKQANMKDGRKGVPVNYDTDGTQGPPGRIYDVNGKDVSNDVVQLYDPNVLPGFNSASGSPQFVSRSDIIQGKGGNVIPTPSQGALDAADDAKKAVANINNLGGLFKDEFVGPIMGRYNDTKSMLPESLASLPEGYANFASASAALKSDVIKAITGSQMNANEEKRILASVPLNTDRGDVWLSKYQQLVQRINVIAALKEQRIGAGSYTLEQLDEIAAGRLKPGQAPPGNATPSNNPAAAPPSGPPNTGGSREIKYDKSGKRIG